MGLEAEFLVSKGRIIANVSRAALCLTVYIDRYGEHAVFRNEFVGLRRVVIALGVQGVVDIR